MKIISFCRYSSEKVVKILQLDSIEDIGFYMAFAKERSLGDLKNYLAQKKPSHIKVNHALSSLVTTINRLHEQKSDKFNVDNCTEEEGDFLNFFTHLNHTSCASLYEKNIKELFQNQGYVRINSSGGIYCGDIGEDSRSSNIEINKVSSIREVFQTENFAIEKDSKFIILENDPEPDSWYKENIKEKFSMIINLREVMAQNRQLESYLYNFKDNVGINKIFVYTTGNDINQMEEYIKIGKKCGFDIEIVFNDYFLKQEKERLMEKYNISYKFL